MVSGFLTLQEAADRLGVHYMTAYRYVRTGRLPASKDGVEWRVRASDLARIQPGPQGGGDRRRPRRLAVEQMVARLSVGDEAGVWALVEAALASGTKPDEIHLDLLAPAMRAIGERWASGTLSIAEEHQASVVAQRVVGRLGPMFARRGRRRGAVVIGSPTGELHSLPGAILADELRAAGFEVIDLGPSTPAKSFADTARLAVRLVAVLIGITATVDEKAVKRVVAATKRAVPGVPVLVGGAAIADEQSALALGADGWSGLDARQAVEVVEQLLARRRQP